MAGSPPTRLTKLGIKPGVCVLLLGAGDASFRRELEAAGARVVPPARVAEADVIFLEVDQPEDLDHLSGLRAAVKPTCAVWTIRRKGRNDLTEAQVMAAGLAAGFVDVKVVRFSDTHTAEKFVIRLVDRGR